MNTDENNQDVVVDTQNTNEGEATNDDGFVKISKSDYEKLNQTLGSLKRENKDLKKPKETPVETPKTNQPDDNGLLQKTFLRSAGITKEKEVELALSTAKKWGVSVDALVDDEDFQAKLEKLRTQESNEIATSNIRGGPSTQSAKLTPEYWIAKGVPPTQADVPDRKTRAKIARAMLSSAKNTGKFYNE